MNDDVDLSVAGARCAAERHQLPEWVEAFLASPGSDNPLLGAKLRGERQAWLGPVELRFDELHRLAGPPDQPTLTRLNDDDLDTVEDMVESVEEGWDPAPLIVSWTDGRLMVEDGNHRIEGLRRTGRTKYWAIVGFDDADQRDAFVDARRATVEAQARAG